MTNCKALIGPHSFGIDPERCEYLEISPSNDVANEWSDRQCRFPSVVRRILGERISSAICPVSRWYHGELTFAEVKGIIFKLRWS